MGAKREGTHYHSVACLILELGRKDRFPEMLGFNSPTVTTPISSNTWCSKFKLKLLQHQTFQSFNDISTVTKNPSKLWCLKFPQKLLQHESHTQIPKLQSFNEISTAHKKPISVFITCIQIIHFVTDWF